MKKERNSRNINRELYQRLEEEGNIEDTRYWGLFLSGERDGSGNRKVRIDPKSFQKTTGHRFSEEQLEVINERRTHYFYPGKFHSEDYNCNLFLGEITAIKKDWDNYFLPLIKEEIRKMKKPHAVCPGDYGNLQCGISGYNAAVAWAGFENAGRAHEYERNRRMLFLSLYAEFFHLMASRVEAVLVRVLSRNNALKDRFDRNALYATAVGKDKKVEELEHFRFFDELYCIWNFIKHNSSSTYKTLNDRYPELVDQEEKYEQGELAMYFILFSEELVGDILNGCGEFFKEYCELVFHENDREAGWNYDDYFIAIVQDETENIMNPLGLRLWDDID